MQLDFTSAVVGRNQKETIKFPIFLQKREEVTEIESTFFLRPCSEKMAPAEQLKIGLVFLCCCYMAPDDFSTYYNELLEGSYDCVDRIVLNAYFPMGYRAGGFRHWWRLLNNGSDDNLDNTHLMRMAGRFSRRMRAYAKANGIPVIDCDNGDKKHQIAEDYLREHPMARGLFMILVSRSWATLWEVKRSAQGVLQNMEAKHPYINHYSFHILDPEWGHLTIKMASHPPFGVQVLVNGHEYVSSQIRQQGLGFTKGSL